MIGNKVSAWEKVQTNVQITPGLRYGRAGIIGQEKTILVRGPQALVWFGEKHKGKG